jgi:alanyl-tRNA synthetase
VAVAAEHSGKRYGASMSPDDVSMRVIADHARNRTLDRGGLAARPHRARVRAPAVMRRAIRPVIDSGSKAVLAPRHRSRGDVMGEQYLSRERRDTI